MNTEETYGPWVDFGGGDRPVPAYTPVEVKFRSGDIGEPRLANDYRWPYKDNLFDIMAYRIVATQPALEAAERMLRANGYTVTKPRTFEDVVPMAEAPPEGTVYWLVYPISADGVASFNWDNTDIFDINVLRHRMAYLDREDALIAARHIYGLKGGEL